MRYIARQLERQVLRAVKNFPAMVLTGPRAGGKTWLLRRLYPRADYFLLEDPDIVARLRADPQGFLDAGEDGLSSWTRYKTCPRCSGFVRSRIDSQPRRTGSGC
jgi:hypothetical protein